MYEFAEELEGLAVIAALSELPEHVEHVEEVGAGEHPVRLQLPETVVDGLFLVGDDDVGDCAHQPEELGEEEGVGVGGLAVGDYQSEHHYLFAVVAASEDAQHVLPVLLGPLAHHAEGQVEPHPLSELQVLLLHLGGDDQQDVGQVRVLLVSQLLRREGVVLVEHVVADFEEVGGEVGELGAFVPETADEFAEGDLVLLVGFAEEVEEVGFGDGEVLLDDPVHGGLVQVGRQVADELQDGRLVAAFG